MITISNDFVELYQIGFFIGIGYITAKIVIEAFQSIFIAVLKKIGS